MLYDTKWDKKTTQAANLQGLIAWLETQDQDREYDFCNRYKCLVAQYLKAIGAKKTGLNSLEIDEMFGEGTSFQIALCTTFGEALKTLKELQQT